MANYLPVLMHSVTANIVPDDSSLETLPRGQVDYLSHNWEEEDVWRSWRNMTRQKNEIANGMRLENASWRTWWKQRNKLKTVNPETLNWLKDSDVTWLYGPLHTAVEWTPPPKPPPDHLERKPASAQDRLDLSLPKHKSILKYRTISELLTSELPSSPVFSPPESDGEVDVASPQDSSESSSRRPSLPHTKSDTHITRWGPDRTFRKDSPPRVEPPGNAANSTTISDVAVNSRQPTPTRVSSSTNLTGYFHSHLHGPQSQNTSQTSSSTSNSASASPRGASSELSCAPAPKKKHITFNTFVEQCIAIDKPKTVNPLGAGSGKGTNGPYEDTDEEHDDGYEEDVEGGDDFDPDLNECAITDSDSDYEEGIFIQDEDDDDDEEDRTGFDNDGVIEMRASRVTKQDKADSKKGVLRSKSKASTSSSSDSYASSTSSSIKKRRPSIPTIPRRRRSGTGVGNLPRSNSNATARPSFNHGPRRNTNTSSDQMVTIAPIAPTMLKTGGSLNFAYPAHSPAWDGFGVHPDTTSGYGEWMDGFGDDALSEDGAFGGPIGRYSGYIGYWRSSDSESPGTPVELVYMPPPSGRYGSAYGGRSPRSKVGSNVNSEEAEVELMEEAGEKRRLGQDEDEEHVQTNQGLLDPQEKPIQRSQSQEDISFDIGKDQGQVYQHQEVMFSTGNSSKSQEREKKSKKRPTSMGETSTGLVSSVPIVVRTPPAVQRPGRNTDDEAEEDAYDYFSGPDLGEEYATRRSTTRRNPKDVSQSPSIFGDERKSRSLSRSKSRTPSPQSATPATSSRSPPSSTPPSSALLSPPLRGRGAAHHQSSVSPDSSSRGRSSTRTSSSSMSDRERPRSRSNHSSPIGSLSPDGSAIGLNYGVYANGRIGDRERDRDRERERAHGKGGRGRERTERRLSHSSSPDSVEGVTTTAGSFPSTSSLDVIGSPQFPSETMEGALSTSSSQTILPPSPPSHSPQLGSPTLDGELMPSPPANSPVITISGVAIAIAEMEQSGDGHGRTTRSKMRAAPMDVSQPHISSPKTSFSVDPSPSLTSSLTSTEGHKSVLPDGSLIEAHVINNSTRPSHVDPDTGKETRDQATPTSDDASIVGKAVGNIMSSARAYLGLWNNGEKEKDNSQLSMR